MLRGLLWSRTSSTLLWHSLDQPTSKQQPTSLLRYLSLSRCRQYAPEHRPSAPPEIRRISNSGVAFFLRLSCWQRASGRQAPGLRVPDSAKDPDSRILDIGPRRQEWHQPVSIWILDLGHLGPPTSKRGTSNRLVTYYRYLSWPSLLQHPSPFVRR